MKSALRERLAARLFDVPEERAAFEAALEAGASARRVEVVGGPAGPRGGLPEWVPAFVREKDGAGEGEGAYGLDLSSVWEMLPLGEIGRPVRRLLDLCAAPGGKSLLAARWVEPEFHLANEVVPKRLGILRHNLARCGVAAFTQRLMPERLAELAAAAFDLVLVDAPCSGQSLLARGIENPGCFHPATVKGNAMRQRKILAAAARCVAPGGWMLFTTCTFAPDENEKNVGWFTKRHDGFEPVAVASMERWRSRLGGEACYRLGPHEGLGAGGFACLLRRHGEAGDLPELAAELTAFPVARED